MKSPSQWRWSSRSSSSITPSSATALLLSTLLLSTASASTPFSCDSVKVDDQTFNFKSLAGPHTVVTHEYVPPTYHNTTYTLDLCAPLKRKSDVKKEEACPTGTRVCAIKHRWDPKTSTAPVDQVIPIIISPSDDKTFEWKAELLKADADKKLAEGISLTLTSPIKYQNREQKTRIEFRCDKDLKGDEGEWDSSGLDKYVSKRAEDGPTGATPEEQFKKDGKTALVWEGYKHEGDIDTLVLRWGTGVVCPKDDKGGDKDKPKDGDKDKPKDGEEESRSWGFFTWFVILVFLAIASYLIFGSWLNYNRYGARGWDLLPHGDTIRDIPYLMKDWTRKVLNTMQSSGSRGGYSAV
ncbi:autophagy-related protein 27 [Podospora fimiseda]|uniref:Autophagy-related protein 27 n=1 Tax=Podospora fimiseda TaxID=252190 RepID=A0AAN7BKG1_9PEZI|nr:autophagy-related protein 27 [Podospora fimiseda]